VRPPLGSLGALAAVALVGAASCGDATIGDPPRVDDDALPPDAAVIDAAPGIDARACSAGDAQAIDVASGTCYVYVAAPTTWDNASVLCEGFGGHLAVPTSTAENVIVAGLPTDPTNLPDSWLGGTDRAHEMTWAWITGEPFLFDNWRTGEPNDGNSNTVAEDCMVVEADNGGTWDDRSCTRLYPFLCELPP